MCFVVRKQDVLGEIQIPVDIVLRVLDEIPACLSGRTHDSLSERPHRFISAGFCVIKLVAFNLLSNSETHIPPSGMPIVGSLLVATCLPTLSLSLDHVDERTHR